MSLSIVLGSSGSGKSTYIYEKIISEAIENRDKNFLVIVPEQYTMSTQRLLVEMHPNHCIMNIDVLSFNRLAYRVFDELGLEVLDVLDDVGKSFVIRRLVSNHLNELGVLKRNITKVNYIAQVKSLISEMTQYNITPDVLRQMIDFSPMSESFRRRASDLLIIYEAFLEYTEGKFVTAEAILSLLNNVLAESCIVAGATVVLDGFTGFTPIQYELVGNMLKCCEEVYVTVTGDISENYLEKKDEDDLFEMSAEFVQRLVETAKYNSVEMKEPILINKENGRFAQNKVLSFLENNIFRNGKKTVCPIKEVSENLRLASLKNPLDELSYVAIEINKMVKSGGYAYKDFAVVCPSLEQYRFHVENIWNDYNIPFFIDANAEINLNPFVEAVSAVFEIFDSNFSKNSVFSFLRTGFSSLEKEEIDTLENYVLSTGIKGKNKYFHPFAIRSNSFREEADLLLVNQIREKFIKSFKDFDEELKKGETVKDIAVALYNFFVANDFEKKLRSRKEKHEKLGNEILAKEYSQIYKIMIDLLDKMVAILGEEQMNLSDFADIFEAGVASASIGVIPPANDSVIIGDMERTRIDGVKVLFCIGASDDAIPKKIENGGILSQLEREQLLEQFEMAPSDRQKAFRQRFYLYMMLTKPSKCLYVTSPRVNGEGKACNTSYLMDLLDKMYSEIKIEPIENFELGARIQSKRSALQLLIDLLKKSTNSNGTELTKEESILLTGLLVWANDEPEIDLNKILDAMFYVHSTEGVSEDVMLAVNEAFNGDETVLGSVSKFETYSDCGYMYFLKYILKLEEREMAELSAIDMGNFYHKALERFGGLVHEDNKLWKTISEEEKKVYIDTAIRQTYESMYKVSTLEDATQSYIVDTMAKTLEYTVDVIIEQVKRGEFEPELFEEKVESKIYDPLGDEIVAILKGTVDRIDISQTDDKGVRIIDYKSSAHKLSLDECFYGLSLQLPIYMNVVLEKLSEKYPGLNVHPSAVLYYKMDNPFVEKVKQGMSLQESRLEASKMDGLVCSEIEDIKANDNTLCEDNPKSSIIPVTLKKGEIPDARSHTIPADAFQILLKYADVKAGYIAKDILEGKFEPSPAKLGNSDACKYCGYKSVCHFDENAEGYAMRELPSLGENAISEMKKIIDGKDEDSNGAD